MDAKALDVLAKEFDRLANPEARKAVCDDIVLMIVHLRQVEETVVWNRHFGGRSYLPRPELNHRTVRILGAMTGGSLREALAAFGVLYHSAERVLTTANDNPEHHDAIGIAATAARSELEGFSGVLDRAFAKLVSVPSAPTDDNSVDASVKPATQHEIDCYVAYSAAEGYLVNSHNVTKPSQPDIFNILKNADVPGVPDNFKLPKEKDAFLRAFRRGRNWLAKSGQDLDNFRTTQN